MTCSGKKYSFVSPVCESPVYNYVKITGKQHKTVLMVEDKVLFGIGQSISTQAKQAKKKQTPDVRT